MAQTMKNMMNSAKPPEIIAETISKALKSKRPRARYAVPMAAKTSIFLSWLLPDRWFDELLRRYLKIPKKL